LFFYATISFLSTRATTTPISTLSLHDALPIYTRIKGHAGSRCSIDPERNLGRLPAFKGAGQAGHDSFLPKLTVELPREPPQDRLDRKSTRLNSSHVKISYAVFCLKKKKTTYQN